jgi:UDP-3-O-acyl-N-acetylglucosamine deacetylase
VYVFVCRGAEAHVEAAKRLQCVSARQFGVRYDVEHLQQQPLQKGGNSNSKRNEQVDDDRLLVISNVNGCKNFNLFTTTIADIEGT